MTYFFEFGLVLGLLAVASNPSPFYAALGLVSAAGAGCFILAGEATFLSLVLFLVYLGGMMVVFAYSAALVAEPYPEAWGSTGVVVYSVAYGLLLWVWYIVGEVTGVMNVSPGGEVVLMDWLGVSALFSSGGWILLILGWALLLTLFVVLEVVRGHYSGVLRAV
uniref:NADH-ubiquinone oxidoreductase chain 6 n=1 Tax=Limnodynastes salmini TaxID=39404 RepID=S4V0M9_LIMSA|nr:NADH dehydrogenase subunit 6 [Limnodynastes salmini]